MQQYPQHDGRFASRTPAQKIRPRAATHTSFRIDTAISRCDGVAEQTFTLLRHGSAVSDRSTGRKFDVDRGVTTQAILFLTDLDPEAVGDAGAHATHYEAVPVADFHALVRHLPAVVIERSSFVDVGAGMGRAIILAREYAFASVTGIEVSPGLFEVARANLTARGPDELELREASVNRGDARIWTYPPGDLVVFMYNPFDATAMRAALGAILHRELPGETWLMYHTPVERKIIESDPQWNIVAEMSNGVVYRYG
ncbi:MAG: class I SAM-dependent methyltransferase [Candidatus Eremiobacteraeota bacterium]|nr:class I SAM-dependent methyltransferase [Candidatus Eremiobacteraeota bacterium]